MSENMDEKILMGTQGIRDQFPILKQQIHGKRFAYLDSAATTQKPLSVIQSMDHFYQHINANVHRAVYQLSASATLAFENARKTVQQFLNAKTSEECIFTKGTTEAINLVAHSFGSAFVKENDEILITMMEHHSNIVPWQMLCQRTGAKLRYIPMKENGELDLSTLTQAQLINPKTKLVAISSVSNAIGTLHPVQEIIHEAHLLDIPVLIDGAQSAPHLPIDVQALDCDFFTFSGHKLYGPTGIGVLYGKSKWLNQMLPYQGGGDMIKKVDLFESLYQEPPYKFEAGTPPIAEAIGLKTALEFLMEIGFDAIEKHECLLTQLAKEALLSIPGIQLMGNPRKNVGIFSFNLKGVHAHDVGTLVDSLGVALRTGHHCAMPLMDFYGVSGSARISFGLYNNREDIEQLVDALHYVRKVFKLS